MALPGVYTEQYIPVLSDTLDILNRIQEIDHTYFVLLNKNTGKFEVHSCAQAGGSFCLELPYPFLDARTLSFVQRYRSGRAKEIFEQMEKENDTLQRRRLRDAAETAAKAAEYLKGRMQ